MSRHAHFDTPETIARRLKEGRGSGDGPNWRPWHEVEDLTQGLGRRHRIWMPRFGRVMHFMSDLERNLGYVAEVDPTVVDLRDQVPLLHERMPTAVWAETLDIARELGVVHPRHPWTRYDWVMTTDQVWVHLTPNGPHVVARPAKYEADEKDERVMEKEDICSTYWERRWIVTKPFNEHDVSENFVTNWDFIRQTLYPDFFRHFSPRLVSRVDRKLRRVAQREEISFSRLSAEGAATLRLPRQEVRAALHYLVAAREWPIDLDYARLTSALPPKFKRSGE